MTDMTGPNAAFSERLGTIVACALAVLGGIAAARAGTPSVRAGALELSATGLLQVDGGDVFDRVGGSQGAGITARRARLGGIVACILREPNGL